MYGIVLIDDDRQVLQSMRRAIPWEEFGVNYLADGTNGEEGLHLVAEYSPISFLRTSICRSWTDWK